MHGRKPLRRSYSLQDTSAKDNFQLAMSVVRHTLFNFGGAIFPMASALITIPVYLRYIGEEKYGALAVIWALLGYFSFFDLGFGRAVAQRMSRLSNAEDQERSELLWTALSITFLLGIFASFLIWLFSDFLLLKLIDVSSHIRLEVVDATRWMLLAMPIVLPSAVLQGALQARLKFAEVSLIQLVTNLISQLLPLAAATFGHTDLNVLVPAALLSRVLMAALLLRQCHRHVPLTGRPVIDRAHLKALLSYGGWVSVIAILSPLLVTVDRLIIAAVSGAKAVAHYTVPYDLVAKSMVVSGSVYNAIFPRLASASSAEAERLAERATAALIAIMTPTVVVGIFLAKPFLIAWIGESFSQESAGVAELILVGIWLNALVIPRHAKFMATSNPKTIAMVFLIQIPVYLFMVWRGLEYWGVIGAAGAWTARVLLDTCMLLRLNHSLAKTVRLAAPYAVLISAASSAVLLFDWRTFVYWGIGISLLGITTVKDRKQFVCLVRAIKTRREVTP